MTQRSNNEEDQNDIVSTQSLTEETTKTITSPPPLPFDVLPEILCRLPVKLLVQLRCLCKFFYSLISDPKFAKKHLQLSTKRHYLIVTTRNNLGEYVQYDSPIPSLFSTSIITQTQLYPPRDYYHGFALRSCDGIFCGMLIDCFFFLWNPSIRNCKILPSFRK